jgi:hypothetical protein
MEEGQIGGHLQTSIADRPVLAAVGTGSALDYLYLPSFSTRSSNALLPRSWCTWLWRTQTKSTRIWTPNEEMMRRRKHPAAAARV